MNRYEMLIRRSRGEVPPYVPPATTRVLFAAGVDTTLYLTNNNGVFTATPNGDWGGTGYHNDIQGTWVSFYPKHGVKYSLDDGATYLDWCFEDTNSILDLSAYVRGNVLAVTKVSGRDTVSLSGNTITVNDPSGGSSIYIFSAKMITQDQSDSGSQSDSYSDSSSSSSSSDSSSSGGVTPVLPTDYVFYAPLVDATASTAETGQALTYNSTPTEATIDGISCLDMRGKFIQAPDTGVNMGTDPLTVSAWVYGISSSTWCSFIDLGYGATGKQVIIGTTGNGVNICGQMYNYYLDSGISMMGNWHNVIFTKKDNVYTLYVDGVQVATTTNTSCSLQSTGYIGLGGHTGANYNGYLAACRIYNRAVTDDEIALLANEFNPPRHVMFSTQYTNFTNAVASTQTLTATPSGCTFSTSDTLPTGVTLNSSGVLTYDGTPFQSGSSNLVSITASKEGFESATANVYISMKVPNVTFTAQEAVFVNGTQKSVQLNATPSGCTFSTSDTLPAGVTLSSAGVLAYDGTTPITQDATVSISVTASKTYYNNATATVTMNLFVEFDNEVIEAELDTTATPTRGTLSSIPSGFTFTTIDGVEAMKASGSGNTGVNYTPLGGNSAISGNHERTFSVWVNPISFNSSGNGVYGNGGRNYNDAFCLEYSNTACYFPWGERWYGSGSPSMIPTGQWTHIVTTYDGTAVKVYYNGVLEWTSTGTASNINSTATSVVVGSRIGNDSRVWNGYLRKFKAWSSALTAQEVSDLYTAELPTFQQQP